jgi:hypothetical protein
MPPIRFRSDGLIGAASIDTALRPPPATTVVPVINIGGAAAVRGPDTEVIASAAFQLHTFALARIGENLPLPRILDLGYLPPVLRNHPAAVVPYLVSRDTFIARLHHQRTGYWRPDGAGLEPRSQEERAQLTGAERSPVG